MICPNCKAEIRDNAIFCPKCGQKIACSAEHGEPPADATSVMPHVPEGQSEEAGTSDASAASDETHETQVFPADAPQPDAADECTHPRSSKKKVVALMLVGILVAGGAAGGAWYYHERQVEQQRKQEEERAAALDALRHQGHGVTFTIQADGYTADDSPIPIEITGTDLDGNAVDTTCYIAQDGTGTTLKSGSYEASVVASPLTKSGTLYAVPDTAISFEIPVPDDESLSADATSSDEGTSDSADTGASNSADSSVTDNGSSEGTTIAGGTIQLAQLDPINQTDDMIEAAYQAALAGGFDQTTAGTYRQAATDAHTAAQKAKEEAEAQAALQKKAQEAHAAYATFLQGTYKWGDDDISLSTCKFAPIDIDGDGVDELLVENINSAHAFGYDRLFAYQNGQVVELTAKGEAHKIFKSGAVLGYWVGTGSFDGWYYTLQNGSLVEVAQYASDDLPASHFTAGATNITDSFKDPGGVSAQYCDSLQVNGADVDLDTYMATASKLADQDVTPTPVDNTAENRSKLLG